MQPRVPSPMGFAAFGISMSQLSGLYVITDETVCPGRTHSEIAQAAVDGGARIIQLRDKTAPDRYFYEAALEIREITDAAGALFLINDRIDIAAAVGVDGVNTGQTDLPVPTVRELLGEGAILGVSAQNLDQARQAQEDGADYIGFGPVFATTTKLDAGPGCGIETLRTLCHEISLPVVAVGGISIENIGSIAANGAACAAVVSAVACARDMAQATADLIREFESAKNHDHWSSRF